MELRVHGVSGTPPVDMLDRPLVNQVAGDADGRFFRPVDSAGQEITFDGHVLEGYHWGPQTSGSWRQALWLVLIPFGLVNAAYFMLPGGGKAARALASAGLRVLATVLTGLVVLALAQAAVDLFAWQWTGLPARGGDPRPWLLAAFAAVVAALLVIRFLVGPPRKPPGGAPPVDDPPTELARGAFYAGDRDLTALRHLHLTVGLTVLSVLAADLARTYGGPGWLHPTAVVLLCVAIVHIALIGDRAKPVLSWTSITLLCLGIVVLAVSVAAMMTVSTYPARSRGILPGIADLGLLAAGLALGSLLLMTGATAVLALRTREPGIPKEFRPFLGGLIGPVVAALGMFLGVGFTAALSYGVLRVLRPGDQPDSMALPLFHVRIAFAAGVAVALAVLLAAVLGLRFLFAAKRFTAMVLDSSKDLLPEDEVAGVARAWWVARLKFAIHWLAITVAGVGTILTVAAVWEALHDLDARECRPSGTPVVDWLSGCADLPGPDLVSIGTTTLVLLGGFLLYVGRRATGDSAVRRSACVVWDVIAFWPAAVHPFVPPPYSPKVIEDLRHRIEWYLDSDDDITVVLAGHSQGSLIAAAALTRLTPANRARVRLLTYGSQLQIAYARAFPAYVNYRFLCWLRTALDRRWVSLYRETDPIGGPVQSWGRTDGADFRSFRLGAAHPEDPATREEDGRDEKTGRRECDTEWRLLDPCPADGDTAPRLAMRQHGSYSLDPAWQAALRRLDQP